MFHRFPFKELYVLSCDLWLLRSGYNFDVSFQGNGGCTSQEKGSIPLATNYRDKTISNIMVEDLRSNIIMANLIPNKSARSSKKLGVLVKQNFNNRQKSTDQESTQSSHDHINANASIINVEDENCDIILRQHQQENEVGLQRRGQPLGTEACSSATHSVNNICKLFVKEKTPPSFPLEEMRNDGSSATEASGKKENNDNDYFSCNISMCNIII